MRPSIEGDEMSPGSDVPGTSYETSPYFGFELIRKVVVYVCVWYVSSISITFANKFILSTVQFRYPFFLTAVGNFIASIEVFVVTQWCVTDHRPVPLPRTQFCRVVVPLALSTTLDLGFSLWSLAYLSVSFHVILKGAAPLFVLIFGLCLRIERPSRRTPVAMLLRCGGMVLVAADKLSLPDRPLGIFLGLLSSAFSGLRWALTQLLMTDESAGALSRHNNPLSTMLHTMPTITMGAFVGVLAFERDVCGRIGEIAAAHGAAQLGLLAAYFVTQATLVFVLVLAEFSLVKITSSLTLSVFGVLKELCTVFIGVMVGDKLSAINVLGLFVCVCGTAIYHAKRTKPSEKSTFQKAETNADGAELIEGARR